MAISRAGLDALQKTTGVLLERDVRAATGDNDVLSRTEQALAPEHVRAAAEAVRAEGGPGTRVTSAALEAHLAAQARQLVEGVNQPAGVGRAFVSRAEVEAARAKSPALGARVAKAYEIATGKTADVDGVAEAYVRPFTADDGVFRVFTSEQTALRHQDPRGRSTTWLVKSAESAGDATFVWGRNDLWSQRFRIDAKTGELTVLAEH